MQHLKPLRLSVFFFALACERTFIKKLALNLDVIGPEIILFPGASIHAFFFCPEMLQTGAVKGLSINCLGMLKAYCRGLVIVSDYINDQSKLGCSVIYRQ